MLGRKGPSPGVGLLSCYACKYWRAERPVTGAAWPRPIFYCDHPETSHRIGRDRTTPCWCPLAAIGKERLLKRFKEEYPHAE